MSQEHDALFKYVFSQPENAASELRSVLPEQLANQIDWGTLEPQPANFVDENLRGRQADLLFKVKCQDRDALLYVLMEHQSTNDPLMAFRVLRYVVKIWDAFLREQPKAVRLPAIIPVVVHHSKGGWKAATELTEIIDVDAAMLPELVPYLPQFRIAVDDISHLDGEALRRRSLTRIATIGLMLLAKARDSTDLMPAMYEFADIFRQVALAPTGIQAMRAFLEYAFGTGDAPLEELHRFAHQIGPVAEEAYMTAAEVLTQRGVTKGKAELLLRQLGLRFGSLSDANREKVLSASTESLDDWAERILTGSSIDEILG